PPHDIGRHQVCRTEKPHWRGLAWFLRRKIFAPEIATGPGHWFGAFRASEERPGRNGRVDRDFSKPVCSAAAEAIGRARERLRNPPALTTLRCQRWPGNVRRWERPSARAP